VAEAREIIQSYLADRDVRHERLTETDWAVQLRGEKKHSITVLLALRERTLQIESFFIRRPHEHHEDVYRMLLRANARVYGVRFSIDDLGDVFLTGRMAIEAVTPDELDRILGSILSTSDEMFMPAIEIGFASYLERDMAWRAAQRSADTPVAKNS
jgi:hypothetical protein